MKKFISKPLWSGNDSEINNVKLICFSVYLHVKEHEPSAQNNNNNNNNDNENDNDNDNDNNDNDNNKIKGAT